MNILRVLLLLWVLPAFGLELGFNQAWIKNRYSHQWINYDAHEAERILQLAKDSNASIVRMWLFEGTNTQGIKWEKNIPKTIDQKYLDNLEHFIQTSKRLNLKLNLTLFDGNIISQDSFKRFQNRWWNLLNNKYKTADHFLANIITPVIKLINNYPNTVTQIDLVNEINALNGAYHIYPQMFKGEWRGLNKFVCKWSKFIKNRTYYDLKTTVSFGWGNAVSNILSKKLDSSCIDFLQIHLYNNEGTIPKCAELKKYITKANKPIQLGEFGQKSKSYDSSLQTKVLKNFIKNAPKCGISSALAWRLSDIRSGENAEARFSFEAFGKPRPAYYVFKNLAENNI